MYLRIVWILLISIFITGCISNQPSKPKWILNPNFDGMITISAQASLPKSGDKGQQERVAKMNANVSISKNKRILINDFCTSSTSTSGISVSQCKSDLFSVDFTRGVKIINRWVDKETNILYIRVIPKKLIL